MRRDFKSVGPESSVKFSVGTSSVQEEGHDIEPLREFHPPTLSSSRIKQTTGSKSPVYKTKRKNQLSSSFHVDQRQCPFVFKMLLNKNYHDRSFNHPFKHTVTKVTL